MNNKTRKALNPCFGTKEYADASKICIRCQHRPHCEKARRRKKANIYKL